MSLNCLSLHRARNSGHSARRRLWIRGRMRPGTRRSCSVVVADESDHANQLLRRSRDCRTRSLYRRPERSGACTKIVLSAGPREHEKLHYWRKCRHECRRTALFEIWCYPKLRNRPRSGAGRWRSAANRRSCAQEQDGIRSDRSLRWFRRTPGREPKSPYVCFRFHLRVRPCPLRLRLRRKLPKRCKQFLRRDSCLVRWKSPIISRWKRRDAIW